MFLAMTFIGYARVSTKEQELTLQEDALKAAGCTEMFREKVSGAKADNRPQLARLLHVLEPGDVVVVCRLDRLARSTRDLLNVVHAITDAGAGFKSLADSWCDTTSPHGKLLLTVMGGFAEFERSLIMSRTQAGISRAKELGVTFGRPVRLNSRQKKMIGERYAKGETMQALAEEYSVGTATIWRALHGAGTE
jgi:DNA invertase Pin-like site-specific DNA recombinase